jgi:sn-glycerol 3-phosphate transport system ATP-binding protein
MNAGHMEQFGTPEEVYNRPASTFVASFIGSPPMNLLKHAPGAREGHILGVRPEHLDVGDEGWELTVDTVELLGAERLVHCRLGDEPVIIRTHEDAGAPTVGSTIRARPREDRLHWFDASTQQRIDA